MTATLVLITVVALCVALIAIFGILWGALHFGVDDDD
jgi:nitrogen fixation-related uncharacterized protein